MTTALRVPETERADLTGSLGNAVACRGTFEWMFDDEFQHWYLDQVSGGQRRRAIVAMVLAEGSPVEIMRPEVLERIYDFPIRVETIDGVPYAIYFRPPTRHGAVSISSRRSVWADQSSP